MPDKNREFKELKSFRMEIRSIISKQVKFGMILLAGLVIGFGGWLVFAKLDKAAIASGEIIAAGNNQVIQHLEGGVVKEIHVKEGDVVKEGQLLITLSKTLAESSVAIYELSNGQAVAEYSRLIAERDGLDEIKYPDAWIANPEKYKDYTDTQNSIFRERRAAYKGKVDILNERNRQLESEIEGLKAQLKSAGEQLEYTNNEIGIVDTLLKKGNTTRTRMLNLQSRKSEITGQMGEYRSSIAKAQQSISENRLNIINLKNETLNEVAEKIKETQSKINESRERGTSASDMLSRTEIRAPIAGVVKDLKYKTGEGSGVIPPNGEVMTIVPSGGNLIAEVKINPNDIDVVRKPHLKCRVRLSAYNARHIPMLDGELQYVSADVFQDPQTRQNYYKGRVTVDVSVLKKYLENNNAVRHDEYLYPGMPAEVFIVTGERSPFSYLAEPIRNDFRRAFRED